MRGMSGKIARISPMLLSIWHWNSLASEFDAGELDDYYCGAKK